MGGSDDMNRGSYWILVGLGYVVVAVAVIGGMMTVRDRAIANMSTPEAEAQWQSYRERLAAENEKGGPVQHAVPASSEPPLLILMRDHFLGRLLGLLVPATALYAVVIWMALGVRRSSWQPEIQEPQ